MVQDHSWNLFPQVVPPTQLSFPWRWVNGYAGENLEGTSLIASGPHLLGLSKYKCCLPAYLLKKQEFADHSSKQGICYTPRQGGEAIAKYKRLRQKTQLFLISMPLFLKVPLETCIVIVMLKSYQNFEI